MAGRVPVLELHGDFRQMGRQYGKLLSQNMQDLYGAAIEGLFLGQKKAPRETLLETGRALFDFYPQRLRELFLGMTETSGLTLEEHVMLNALEVHPTVVGCSALAAWGNYTSGGPLVVGRNYDWFGEYHDFARHLAVTVFNPPSSIPTALVTYAGVLYATTGMNREGLFLLLNNGGPSGGLQAHVDRVPTIVMLFSFLLDAGHRKQLGAAFQTTLSDFSFVVCAADPEEACCYEWPPHAIRKRGPDRRGLLAATNTFEDPSWGLAVQDTFNMQPRLRRENLLRLAEKYKGAVTAERMMEIMELPMDQGGPAWPEGAQWQTVYQVISVPAERTLWVRVPRWQEWEPVELEGLFRGRADPGNDP